MLNSLQQRLTRVPLIVSWPTRFLTHAVSTALVELIDLAPTLLALGGAAVAPRMQGKSLLSLLCGEGDLHQHRDVVRSEFYRALNADAPERSHLNGSYGTMVRQRRYKLVVYHDREEGELFDLENDPGEFTNLWRDPAHAAIRFRLLKRNFDALAYGVDIGPKQVTLF